MKVYVVMQYKGLEPVGEGTVIVVCLTREVAEVFAAWFNDCRIGDDCFAVEEYNVSKGS